MRTKIESGLDDSVDLVRSEVEFRSVVEAAPSAMLMADARGMIKLANKRAESLFGYSCEELLGQPVEMLVPERFRAAHSSHRSGFHASPTTRAMGAGRDLYGLRKDRSEVPIEIGLNPIRTAEGDFVLASIIDITERKRAEQALRESEERFRSVVEGSPIAKVMVDARGRITLVNARTESLFGYPRAELMGQAVEMLVPERFRAVHPGNRAGFHAAPASRAMGAERELFGLRKDGGEVPIEIGLNPIRTAEGDFVLASIIDIAERKRAEQALRESEERLRLAIETTEVGIWEWNVGTNRVRWDTQMFRIYGIEPTEDGIVSYGNWCEAVLAEDLPQQEAILKETVARGGRSAREFRIRRHSDGRVRFIQAMETTRVNKRGETDWVVGTNLDITERREAEMQREELVASLQDKTEQMERFLYMVSHDLKSPLITIKSFAGMVSVDLSTGHPERVSPDLDRIEKAADRMNSLLEELLKVSRVGRVVNPPEAVSLTEVAEEARDLVAGRLANRDVTVKIQSDMPVVNADRPRLVEVLQNLLDNAAKFMGGQAEPRIEVGADSRSNPVRFFVRDNGSGMEPRHQERIFNLFDKLDPKSEGTGVGLALVKRIIETHGGKIWVESEGAGRGTTFWFTLSGAQHATKHTKGATQ